MNCTEINILYSFWVKATTETTRQVDIDRNPGTGCTYAWCMCMFTHTGAGVEERGEREVNKQRQVDRAMGPQTWRDRWKKSFNYIQYF